jgi:transposase
VTAAQLLSTCGDNPDRLHSEAAFASLCGVSPVPASSGKTTRHRLNRGGDRQANRALYVIAVSRMAHDARTCTYVQRRTDEGLSKKEIIRCLIGQVWVSRPDDRVVTPSVSVRGRPRCRAASTASLSLAALTCRGPRTGVRDMPQQRAEQ